MPDRRRAVKKTSPRGNQKESIPEVSAKKSQPDTPPPFPPDGVHSLTHPHKEKKQPLEGIKDRLDDYRTDKVQAGQDFGKDFVPQCQQACKKLLSLGYEAEVNSLLKLIPAPPTKPNPTRAKKITMRGYSLQSLCRYLEEGEQALFSDLPVLFQMDYSFFLNEPWIQKLFAQWHQQGDQEKIDDAFFGRRRGKKGIRSYKLVMENLHRDEKIFEAVEELLKNDCGYRDAMRQVSTTLQSLGLRDKLTPSTIRRVYEQWKRGVPSFVRFFSSL